MDKIATVFNEVSGLYAAATTSMGGWMWSNHTQWVADKGKQLAEKYGASGEVVYCAALLHDLADSRYERGHPDFDSWSRQTSEEVLTESGFSAVETSDILEAVRTHSCRPGNLPTSLEGKVLATTDGMWHVQTNFFPVICYMNRPESTKTYAQWQEWFGGKIERDFNAKIFFEDERAEVKEDYEALRRVFGNRILNTNL